jgi:DNA-binding GntR family transcriptional regulator
VTVEAGSAADPPIHTSAGRAYATIKERIVTLEMAPGSAIRERALAENLCLGRTPVREALKLLEAEQLVMTVPGRGMFVSNVSIMDLQQIAEIRVELESLAARLAVVRATATEIAQLEQYCDLTTGTHELQPSQAIHVDRRLHALFANASHNDYLAREIERFYSLSLRLWHLAFERVHTADLDMTVHSRLVGAMKARNADLAGTLMRDHIHNFQRSIRAAM